MRRAFFPCQKNSSDCIFGRGRKDRIHSISGGGNREEPSSPTPRKKYWIVGGAIVAGIGILLGGTLLWPTGEKAHLRESREALLRVQPPPPPPPGRVVAGKISKGQNLSTALRSQGLPKDLVETICRHLKSVVNLRRVKPGDAFEVRLNPEGQFLNLLYTAGPLDIYQLSLTPAGEWLAVKKEVAVDKYWVRVSGEILTSLFDAMDQAGERDPLVMNFADIFAWEIDFHTDPQPGDRFEMVVEKYYVGDAFVRYGRLLYAVYERENRKHQAVYFEPAAGKGDYYTLQGESLRKALLRSPLKFTRISSGYSRSRPHPILGGNRPHLGIDYAAPVGTPIWAVADGTVVSCGWNGGYGKQITIKHPKGYQSLYGHLSGFASGIAKGRSVRQKQVIGFVGATGLATGPHLDFRLQKNGVYRNPLKEISPRALSLTEEEMPGFQRGLDPFVRWVSDSSASPVQKIASLTNWELENLSLRKRK